MPELLQTHVEQKLSITQWTTFRFLILAPVLLQCFTETMKEFLNRAGRTIKAGAELERAAVMYAREPVPNDGSQI